jgi:hypothetical protein
VTPCARRCNHGVEKIGKEPSAKSHVQESWASNVCTRNWTKCTITTMKSLTRLSGEFGGNRRGNLRWRAL